VRFSLLTKSGRVSTRKSVGDRGASVLYAAASRYFEDVEAAFEGAGIRSGYREQAQRWHFQRAYVAGPRAGYPPVEVVTLEPWGFAGGTLDEPKMADTGSTPTGGRARTLLCYQAPLRAEPNGEGRVAFRRVYVVDDSTPRNVVPEQKGDA
jgi:hypothetical protein